MPLIEAVQADGTPPSILIGPGHHVRTGLTFTKLLFLGGAEMRAAPDDARICFNLKGSSVACEWNLAGRRLVHAARPGALYVTPPGIDWTVESRSDVEILNFALSPERLGAAAAESGIPNGHLREMVGGEDPALLSIARAMDAEAGGRYGGGVLYWTSLADRLLSRLIGHHLTRSRRPLGGVLSNAALRRVNDFIDGAMDQAIELNDLADAAAQSRFHFQRTFTTTLGITPHRYVMLRRVRRAVTLISHGSTPLAAVAVETGFTDQSHLSRWIRAVHGLTPQALRAGRKERHRTTV